MTQEFIDIFVRNFQPVPEIYLNNLFWYDKNNNSVSVYFGNEDTYYRNGDKHGKFKFDGTAESIPEELMDMIFKINGFIG